MNTFSLDSLEKFLEASLVYFKDVLIESRFEEISKEIAREFPKHIQCGISEEIQKKMKRDFVRYSGGSSKRILVVISNGACRFF